MKRFLSLLLAVCMMASLFTGLGYASDEPTASEETAVAVEPLAWTVDDATGAWTLAEADILVPAAYLDDAGAATTSVVGGYYAETAPILIVTGGEVSDTTALANGFVVAHADADGVEAMISYLTENAAAIPGDEELIVVIATGEAAAAVAELSVSGAGMYAAVLYNPAVAGSVDEDALVAAYGEALESYLLSTYQSSYEDGPNVVYVIDSEGAQADCEENAAGFTVDYDTLAVTTDGVVLTVDGTAGDTVIDPAAGDNAAYYYIRANQDDTAVASAALALGESLKNAGDTVNCAVAWGDEGESVLFDWLERVCKYEVQYSSEEIETVLNLENLIASGEYSWKAGSSVYTISYVPSVANPELADYQGLSIAIPAAYVAGIDDDGNLIIDWEAEVVTPNGAVYTAATAPIIINTGAAGYSSSTTSGASSSYAEYGYINVSCGNRGKNNVCTDAEGNSYYCGDAPYCLVDQKAVVRWLKYNIELGNICGSADRIVSTGGSGGGAHSLMLAATGNHSDFYPYLEESGAVGVYYDETSDSYYATISDAIWGACPYSPITNLEEADLAYEWESLISLTALDDIDADEFLRTLSAYVAEAYVEYVNSLGLVYDLDGDGVAEAMTINADGVSGTYVDYMVQQAESDLEWFLNHISSVSLSVTWENEDGESQAEAYFYGHYSYSEGVDGLQLKGYDLSEFGMVLSGSEEEGWTVEMTAEAFLSYRSRSKGVTAFDRIGFLDENGDYNAENMEFGNETQDYRHWDSYLLAVLQEHAEELSALYSPDDTYGLYETYEDMLAAFEEDVAIIENGDEYYSYTDTTIVELYNPLRYILDEETEQPTWVRLVHGTQDKDVSLMATQNDAIAWTMQGVTVALYWSWDNVHVATDPLDTSKTSYIDAMAMLEDGIEIDYPITSDLESGTSSDASSEASGELG